MKHKLKFPKSQVTRADFVPSTYNDKSRTVDVVFATDTPVLRYSWDGPFYEVLDMAGHKTDRSAGSLPVLNNHDRYSGVKAVVGRAENVRLENGKWVATIRFSSRDEVAPIVRDIQEGILQDISVGYSVLRYEKKPDSAEIPTFYAREWESKEISFVTVPADHNAKVRSNEGDYSEIEVEIQDKPNQTNKSIMKREQIIALLQKRGVTFQATATDEDLARILAEEFEKKPAVSDEERAATETNAIKAERTRVKQIFEAVRAAKLTDDFGHTLVEGGKPIDDCRAAIIAELAKGDEGAVRSASPAAPVVKTEQITKVRAAMEEAIAHRVDPSVKLDKGAEFRGMGLLDMGRFCLEQAGVKTMGMSKREVAQLSLNMGERAGYMSSSDFPIILGNTVNRTLRAAYDLQVRTFQPFARRANASDFKQITRAQLSGLVGGFDTIPEGGEYKVATMTEGKEVYSLVKYGKKIAITWEAIINDDLNAFSRIPQAIAAKAAIKQSDLVYAILTGNTTMGDGIALFHASHGNLGSAAAINSTSMAAARAAMRKQTGHEGDYINVMPKYLVVGPDKETEAQMLINATIVAAKTSDTNVFRGSAEIIVDPRITGNKWFLIADPSQIDTVEYAFLDGEGELFTEQRTGFDVDGMEMKARMVFATKAIDHRGMYYNPGA